MKSYCVAQADLKLIMQWIELKSFCCSFSMLGVINVCVCLLKEGSMIPFTYGRCNTRGSDLLHRIITENGIKINAS